MGGCVGAACIHQHDFESPNFGGTQAVRGEQGMVNSAETIWGDDDGLDAGCLMPVAG